MPLVPKQVLCLRTVSGKKRQRSSKDHKNTRIEPPVPYSRVNCLHSATTYLTYQMNRRLALYAIEHLDQARFVFLAANKLKLGFWVWRWKQWNTCAKQARMNCQPNFIHEVLL